MPKLTAAFARFETRLDEVNHLILIARKYSKLKSIINDKDQSIHTNALVRSATVLLSSHIQGYIEDIAELVIDKMISDGVDAQHVPDALRFYATKSSIEAIRDTADPSAIIQRIRSYSASHIAILANTGAISVAYLGSEYKGNFGNPTVDEIKKFFLRFGVKDFPGQMGKRLKNQWPIAENAINQIVDRRNKIAHGDSQATLTVKELSDYCALVRKFISASDRVITSHFSAKGCKFWV